jgi:pimeloyl-ACP methyl ester carboxylesterase
MSGSPTHGFDAPRQRSRWGRESTRAQRNRRPSVRSSRQPLAHGIATVLAPSTPAGTLANRSQFFKDVATPFFSANREGSTVTQGMRDLFWFQGLQGGLLAEYETSFSWQLDYTEDARRIDVPTLVIHGDDDQIVPIDAGGRRAAEIIPNARLIVYPGGNHGIAITDPDRVNADLLAFLSEGVSVWASAPAFETASA